MDIKRVPAAVWQEVYQFQTPTEVVRFALSNKANYAKVLRDLERFYEGKCSKLTDWKASLCLAEQKCTPVCLTQKHFGDFAMSLPQLLGQPVVYRDQASGARVTDYKAKIVQLELRFYSPIWTVTASASSRGQWDAGAHYVVTRDGFSGRARGSRFRLSLGLSQEIAQPGQFDILANFEVIVRSVSFGEHWSFTPAGDHGDQGDHPSLYKHFRFSKGQQLRDFPTQSLSTLKVYPESAPSEGERTSQVSLPVFRYRGSEASKVPVPFKRRSLVLRKRLKDATSDHERQQLREQIKTLSGLSRDLT
jgi:hypothetical protein